MTKFLIVQVAMSIAMVIIFQNGVGLLIFIGGLMFILGSGWNWYKMELPGWRPQTGREVFLPVFLLGDAILYALVAFLLL